MSKRSLASAFSSPAKEVRGGDNVISNKEKQRRNFEHIGSSTLTTTVGGINIPPSTSNSELLTAGVSPGRRLVGSRSNIPNLMPHGGELMSDILVTEKIVNDPIHKSIKLDRLSCRIIDTPQYQRLRHLKQLGTSEYVFPSARHTRFEHSLGVAHLAERVCRNLRDNQPELGITDVDILCVKIAGLCHDLGHGPFSHVYDGVFIKMMYPNGLNPNLDGKNGSKWRHEDGSVDMLNYLLKDNNINLLLYGISSLDKLFIEEIIRGTAETKRQGRAPDKYYMYDIVNNTRSGLDVDKLDYFQRDMYYSNVTFAANFERFIELGRVIRAKPITAANATLFNRQQNGGWQASQSQGQSSTQDPSQGHTTTSTASSSSSSSASFSNISGLGYGHLAGNGVGSVHDGYQFMVCYPQKLVCEAIDVFSVRFRMHKTVYTHKAAKQIEFMITDILALANDHIKIKGKCTDQFPDGMYKISECVLCMQALSKLNDSIIELIRYDQNPMLDKARTILKRLEKRELYSCLGKSTYSRADTAIFEMAEKDINAEIVDISKKLVQGKYDSAHVAQSHDYLENENEYDGEGELLSSPNASDLDFLEPCGNSQDSFYSVKSTNICMGAANSCNQNSQSGAGISMDTHAPQYVELTLDDCIVEKMHIHYGLKEKNPVSKLRFFTKNADSDVVGEEIKPHHYKTSMPLVFEEMAVRVFCRNTAHITKFTAHRAFQIWCKLAAQKCSAPFQSQPADEQDMGISIGMGMRMGKTAEADESD